jgi:hypothetical protein
LYGTFEVGCVVQHVHNQIAHTSTIRSRLAAVQYAVSRMCSTSFRLTRDAAVLARPQQRDAQSRLVTSGRRSDDAWLRPQTTDSADERIERRAYGPVTSGLAGTDGTE